MARVKSFDIVVNFDERDGEYYRLPDGSWDEEKLFRKAEEVLREKVGGIFQGTWMRDKMEIEDPGDLPNVFLSWEVK
jgi:hypothetical protein